eukprot:COSAG02_NODE_7066_length_3201_cov_1.840748_2_plen_352_part_00
MAAIIATKTANIQNAYKEKQAAGAGGAATSSDAAPPRCRAGGKPPPRRRARGKEPANKQLHEEMKSRAASGERPQEAVSTEETPMKKTKTSPVQQARAQAQADGDEATVVAIEAAIKAVNEKSQPPSPAPAPAPVTHKSPAASAKRPAQATTTKPSVKKQKKATPASAAAPAASTVLINGKFGGGKCEDCNDAIPIENITQKRDKGMYRDLHYMDMLCGGAPTADHFEWTKGKKVFVFPGWQITSSKVKTEMINTHIAALAANKDLPKTWNEWMAVRSKSAPALCLKCWNEKCEAAGLQVRNQSLVFVTLILTRVCLCRSDRRGGVSVSARRSISISKAEYQYQQGERVYQ